MQRKKKAKIPPKKKASKTTLQKVFQKMHKFEPKNHLTLPNKKHAKKKNAQI